MERGTGMDEMNKKYEELTNASKAFVAATQSICEDLISQIKKWSNENERLQEENKELHGQIDEMEKDLNRGFPITEEEEKSIRDWMRKHDEEVHGADYANEKYRYSGAIGGAYEYIFIPTSIGVIGMVRCSCGEKFTFRSAL